MIRMTVITIIAVATALLVALAARYWYVPFLRKPEKIDLGKMGLIVNTQKHQERVRDILTAFYGGFNAMLVCKEGDDVRRECDRFSRLLRPFAYEGAAMGYCVKSLFKPRHRLKDFERVMQSINESYFFMYYIGVGFGCAMLYRFWPARVKRMVNELDSYYRELCYDGFGFKMGMFNYLKNPGVVKEFSHFDGYARHACYQGFGRSLWFLYMNAPWLIEEHVARLDESYRGDCYSGLGLAVTFTNMDRPRVSFDFADTIPGRYRSDYFLGMMLAFYTRRMNDSEFFEGSLARLEPWQRDVAISGLEICDSRFDYVDAGVSENHYKHWREGITEDLRALLSAYESETVRLGELL